MRYDLLRAELLRRNPLMAESVVRMPNDEFWRLVRLAFDQGATEGWRDGRADMMRETGRTKDGCGCGDMPDFLKGLFL